MSETFTRKVRSNNAVHIPIEIVESLKLKKDMLVRITIEPINEEVCT